MTALDPTGEQFQLRSPDGRTTAQIAQLGASLRALCVGGIELIERYPEGTSTPAASGIVLVPWPNRIRDGRWTQRGQSHQLALSEPALGNASHGLLRFFPYRGEVDGDTATLEARIFPQTGYPFRLRTRIVYRVHADGITVTHTIENETDADAPVALGIHPYLCLGEEDVAELSLQLDADRTLVVDERNLPTGVSAVTAANDLRTARRLGELSLDTCYLNPRRGEDDRIRALLSAPDGRRLELWAGPGFGYLQVFTTDRYPGRPLAVAIEPMTAPADAFNSGEGLRWLAPGESWTLEWGLTLHR